MKIDISPEESEKLLASFLEAHAKAARLDALFHAEQQIRMNLEEDKRHLQRQLDNNTQEINRLRIRPTDLRDPNFLATLSPIFALVAKGNMKIPAIKALREMTGCLLKEAKDCVEGHLSPPLACEPFVPYNEDDDIPF